MVHYPDGVEMPPWVIYGNDTPKHLPGRILWRLALGKAYEPPRRTQTVPGSRAFGWLEPGHAYRTGECPAPVLARLQESRARPVRRTRGFLPCGFCDDRQALSSASVHIRVKGTLWEAPCMVLHYITEHHYLPPDEIIEDTLTNWHPGQGEGQESWH